MLDKIIGCEIHISRKLGHSFFQSFGIWLKTFSYQFFFWDILIRQDFVKFFLYNLKNKWRGERTPHNNCIYCNLDSKENNLG